MNRKILPFVAALLFFSSRTEPALAQALEHGRGNIVSIDLGGLKVELRDPQGRTGTRSFARDATVKFTDGASFFANPSIHDLRAPMYVRYMFKNEVIEHFEVVELGFDPSASAAKGQGVPRTVVGRVLARDAGQRQLVLEPEVKGEVRREGKGEVRREGRGEGKPEAKRETFQLTSRTNTPFEVGDRVELRTEWSGPRELVVELRVLDDKGRERPRKDNRP